MIAKYAIKKLLVLVAIFVSIFGGLQLNFVQHKLLSLFSPPSTNIQFKKISGLFPFNFAVYDLSMCYNNTQIDVNHIKLSLSGRMFHVKQLEIDEFKITPLAETKLCPSDFKVLIPVITQRFVKNIKINKLDIAGEKINSVTLKYDRKTKSSELNFGSSIGSVSAKWKFDEGLLNGHAKLGGQDLDLSFNTGTNKLHLATSGITLDGKVVDKFLTGTLKYVDMYATNVKIWTEDEFIIGKFNDTRMNTSGMIRCDLDKLVIKVYDVQIGKKIILTPINIDKSFKVSDFLAKFPKGQIKFSGTDLSHSNFSLGRITIEDIDISKLEWLPHAKGIIKGVSNYDGKGNPTLLLAISNLEYMGQHIPIIRILCEYANNKIVVKAETEILRAKHQVNLSINTKDWLIDGFAHGLINIQDYKIASGQRLRGRVKYQIKASGNLKAPDLTGNVSISNGVYVNLISGTYIRDITLLGQLQNKTLDITKIYARDDSKIGGTINGSGKISYMNDRLHTDIRLQIDKFKAVDQKWLNAQLFGNVSLNGDLLNEVKVKGDLYTEKPAIDVSGIVLLSMRSTDLIAKKKPKIQSTNAIQIRFPTDIKLSIRPELSISGFGLQSSWDANAKVSGDLLEPRYVLEAKLKSGKIELTDNAFKLKDGNVLINNEDTKIYVAAEKIIDKITVGAKFTQKEGQSKVAFYSNPYMSDKDVMSYMLFEKNVSEISMGEAMSLLSIMTKLSGGTDFNILGRMKTIFGVDTISMKKGKTASGEEYDAVSLGKKIGKFKVSVDQATGSKGTNVVAEVDVAKNTKVSVDLSSKDSFGGGVLWSRRY